MNWTMKFKGKDYCKKIKSSNLVEKSKKILASGRVLDINGEPIIGATVLEKVLLMEQLQILMEIFL